MTYEEEMRKVVDKFDLDEVIKRTKEMGIRVLSPSDEDYLGYSTITDKDGNRKRIDLDEVFDVMKNSGDIK